MDSFEDRIQTAPLLDQDRMKAVLEGEENIFLFRLSELADFDAQLLEAYRSVSRIPALGSQRHTPTAQRFLDLKVRGGMKAEVCEPYLFVRRDLVPTLPSKGKQGFAYDVGGRVYAVYPDHTGIGREGVTVSFPLVSYVGPASPRGVGVLKSLTTKLRSPGDAQTIVSELEALSVAESQERYLKAAHGG